MAKHSASQTVQKVLCENPKMKEIVAEKLLNQLMNAVKIEAVMGETIVSLEPTREIPVTELDAVSYVRSVHLTPLVRCRDCENWDTDWVPNHAGEGQYFCPILGQVTDTDFYCGCGRRKGGRPDDG